MNREELFSITDWFLPRKVVDVLATYYPRSIVQFVRHRNKLIKNRDLLNRHLGKRCFILCNGPSVMVQDVSKLKGEIVISVSSGYLHPAYKNFAPLYHCVPQITYKTMTELDVVNWFKEMQNQVGRATLFLSLTEQNLVEKYGLFPNNEVRYVCMGRTRYPSSVDGLDLSGIIPGVQSVPLMAIMVALYIGCKEIYLLGTEHDWFVKKEYKYFYEPTVLAGKDFNVNRDGSIKGSIYDELPSVTKLWQQYRAIRLLASQVGVRIINATSGGLLDEFDRVEFENLF